MVTRPAGREGKQKVSWQEPVRSLRVLSESVRGRLVPLTSLLLLLTSGTVKTPARAFTSASQCKLQVSTGFPEELNEMPNLTKTPGPDPRL